MIRVLAAVLLIAAFVGIACGDDDDEPDIPDDIDVSEELPADWPADFPLYPDAELEAFVRSTEEGAQGDVATFQSNDDVQDIIGFFEDEFTKGPWTMITDPVIEDTSGSFLVQDADGGSAGSSVSIDQENGNTAIVIVISEAD